MERLSVVSPRATSPTDVGSPAHPLPPTRHTRVSIGTQRFDRNSGSRDITASFDRSMTKPEESARIARQPRPGYYRWNQPPTVSLPPNDVTLSSPLRSVSRNGPKPAKKCWAG